MYFLQYVILQHQELDQNEEFASQNQGFKIHCMGLDAVAPTYSVLNLM